MEGPVVLRLAEEVRAVVLERRQQLLLDAALLRTEVTEEESFDFTIGLCGGSFVGGGACMFQTDPTSKKTGRAAV